MNTFIRYILFLLPFTIPTTGKGNDTIYFSNQNSIKIVKEIKLITNTTANTNIQAIIKGANTFTQCGKDDIHIPFNSPDVWYKCSIKNRSNNVQKLNLELENATIYELQFFSYDGRNIDSSQEMGIKYPFDQRQIKANSFIYPFTLKALGTTDIYFHISTKGDVLNIPVKLYNNEAILNKLEIQSTMLGIIIGFIIALMLFALYSLYVSNKEYTYIYFALYSIFGGLWILNNDGFTYQYLLYSFPSTYLCLVKMVPLMAIYLFSQFGIRYLSIKESYKFFYNVIYWYNWILLITVLIMPFNIVPQALIVQTETFQIVTVTILNFVAALFSFKQNKNTTLYYLVANIVLILGVLSVSFNIVYGFSSVELRGTIMKTGLLFQMTVLLFALTNKIRESKKLADLELKDSKQKYFDILENAIEAIFIIQDKKIKFCNTQLSILTKYRISELLDFDFTNIIHKDDKEKINTLLNQQLRAKSSGKKIIFRSIDREGYEIWMEMISVPITWEGKPASLNFMNDISQRILSEKEKEMLEKRLLHAQKMETIGTLAGGIAHDFNNILTPIIGYSELLLTTVSDEEQKEDIKNIKTSAYRAKELVSQILRFGHQIDPSRETVDVNKIVLEVIKLLEAVIPSSINITTKTSENSIYVNINPTQLHQVIMNLCTNAYQSISSFKGQITVSISKIENNAEIINLGTNAESKYVKITIEDNGIGIDPSIKSRIFDPFFTTKKIGEGTGLGLSVVYGIVKNNGGIIQCESSVYEGSRFDIYLPICKEDEIIIKEKIVIERGNNEEILIIDDDVKITRMLKKMLDAQGYKTSTENNSLKAFEMIKKNPTRFRLLLSDLTMPELTGIELAKLTMQINPTLKYIFITGHITQSYSETLQEIPHSVLIRKPIDFELLQKAINEQLKN